MRVCDHSGGLAGRGGRYEANFHVQGGDRMPPWVCSLGKVVETPCWGVMKGNKLIVQRWFSKVRNSNSIGR